MVYYNYNGLVMGFSPTQRPSDAVLSVLVVADHVTLCFLKGAGLEDPDSLLKGAGSTVRHIRLAGPSDLDEPRISRLVALAIAEMGEGDEVKVKRERKAAGGIGIGDEDGASAGLELGRVSEAVTTLDASNAATGGKTETKDEGLFKAHFTEGKNIADRKVLVQLGTAAGLDSTEVAQMLEEGSFSDAVQHDIQEARALGIQGVPFFVIDRKYAVSGAQSPEVFLSTLEKALKTWEEGQK